jgi:hypothetical protein
MENRSTLALISEQLKELQTLINSFSESTAGLSRIDIDVAKEKIRLIYENLDHLEFKTEFTISVKEEEIPKVEEPLQEKETDALQPGFAIEEFIPETVEKVPEQPEERSPAENPPTLADLFNNPATQKVSASGKTVVEKIAEQKPVEIMADKMSKKKIESLIKAIGINEKFHFINELFDGNMKAYNTAIEAIDKCDSLESAKATLQTLREQHQWDSTNEAFDQLLELVERKYI